MSGIINSVSVIHVVAMACRREWNGSRVQSQVWSLVCWRSLPGQHPSHLHGTVVQLGQIVSQRLVVGIIGGGSQKPIEAKQSHAWLSLGQHEGQSCPGV